MLWLDSLQGLAPYISLSSAGRSFISQNVNTCGPVVRWGCRRLERQFCCSYSDAARQAWTAVFRKKYALFETKKTHYWRTRLRNEGHSPHLLWWSLDSILRRGKESGLSSAPVARSADDFQCFFEANVQSVRASTAGYAQTAGATTSAQVAESLQPSMTTWWVVSTEEVQRIVLAKSCSLDLIPTYLLRDCIDALLPFLTAMVNASLCEGHLPVSQKMAVVTPW